MVLWLALAFLEFLQATQHFTASLSDIIRLYRQAHAERLLRQTCQLVIQTGSVAEALSRYAFALAPAQPEHLPGFNLTTFLVPPGGGLLQAVSLELNTPLSSAFFINS